MNATLIKILGFSLILIAFGAQAQTELRYEVPYQNLERVVLQDSIENINLRDYLLADYGDSIIVFTQVKSGKKDIVFDFRVFGKDGSKGSHVQVPLQKEEVKYLKRRYSVGSFAFYDNHLYLKLGYRILVLSFGEEHSSEYFSVYYLEQSYSYILASSLGVFLQLVNIGNDGTIVKDKVALTRLVLKDGELLKIPIDAFTPDNYFLMFFETKQYYAIDPEEEIIVKLYCDKPKLEVLNFDGEVITSYDMDIPWRYFDPEEVIALNKKADRDPYLVFGALKDRFSEEASVNTRVDFIESGRFLVSQNIPNDSLDYNMGISLHAYANESVERLNIRPANLNRITDGLDGLSFPFSNSKIAHYFFSDGRRYQLGIVPHFDSTLTDDEAIKEQQEESFISNRFELCLYSGELKW